MDDLGVPPFKETPIIYPSTHSWALTHPVRSRPLRPFFGLLNTHSALVDVHKWIQVASSMTQHPFCLSCISGCFQHGDTSKELAFYVATWLCTCQPAFRNGRCGGSNETKVSAWNGQLVVCVYRLPGLSHPAKATSKPRC